MATYFIDDGGDGTTEDSWATADTSMKDLDVEKAFASGDVIYFGQDMQCQATHSATLTINLPAIGAPTYLISATTGSDPVTYQASTTYQIDTTEGGTYDIIFDGSHAIYGLSLNSGRNIQFIADDNELGFVDSTRCIVAANQYIYLTSFYGKYNNLHVDLTNDATTARTAAPIWANGRNTEIIGLTFTNAGYRTGTVFFAGYASGTNLSCSGADFSGFTNATACEIVDSTFAGNWTFNNCLTAATWTPVNAAIFQPSILTFINCGPADAPTYLYYATYVGTIVSTTSIYRTGGATVESDACSWLVTTTANNTEGVSFTSPWIYGEISSAGSKTFTVYITNDTADFTDAQVWLEVEYLGTADEANTTLASDHRVITTTAANQTDDTTSTWNGTGPSFTYKQSLAVTATIGETGQYRARVCVGVASIASSRYFYIDPKVTVS